MLTVKVRPVYSRVSVVGYYRSMTGKKLGGPTILNVPVRMTSGDWSLGASPYSHKKEINENEKKEIYKK